MKRGQGSVAIVAILVVFVILLVGTAVYYRNEIFGPKIVNAVTEKETIRENNVYNSTTVINNNNNSPDTVVINNPPDNVYINNPPANVENNININNTNNH